MQTSTKTISSPFKQEGLRSARSVSGAATRRMQEEQARQFLNTPRK